MNLPYINQFDPYWSGSSSGLRHSTCMQSISAADSTFPSTNQQSSIFPSPLFRPYDQFINSVPQGLNRLNTSSESAFKPVRKNCPKTRIGSSIEQSPNICVNGSYSNYLPNYQHSMVTATATATTANCYPNVEQSLFSPQYSNIDENPNKFDQMKIRKDLSITGISSIQHHRLTNVETDETSYHWNSPLKSKMKNPASRPEITIPPKKFHTQTHRHEYKNDVNENVNEVPVIDLTLSEDIEQMDSLVDCSRSFTKLDEPPTLDANGNQILISIATESVQDTVYDTPLESNTTLQNQHENDSSDLLTLSNNVTGNTCSEQIKCPILYSNLIKNTTIPSPKKQSKYDINYNRWMQYLRSYNGFRLFVQRNYTKTRLHGISKGNKLFIQNTLLKWWNLLSVTEKEQYARVAELKWCKPLPKPNK